MEQRTEFDFVSKEEILKGWSSDKKYCVILSDGQRNLYRTSPSEQMKTKALEFKMMKRVATFGVPMCQPLEFGTCSEGVYSLQSWKWP